LLLPGIRSFLTSFFEGPTPAPFFCTKKSLGCAARMPEVGPPPLFRLKITIQFSSSPLSLVVGPMPPSRPVPFFAFSTHFGVPGMSSNDILPFPKSFPLGFPRNIQSSLLLFCVCSPSAQPVFLMLLPLSGFLFSRSRCLFFLNSANCLFLSGFTLFPRDVIGAPCCSVFPVDMIHFLSVNEFGAAPLGFSFRFPRCTSFPP